MVGETGVAAVTTSSRGDAFADIEAAVKGMLSSGATFSVDRKAGLLQVTDFPERIMRVSEYLDAVRDRVHRQVQIDARVIEVELNDEAAQGLDWDAARAGRTVAGRGAGRHRPARACATSAGSWTRLAEQGDGDDARDAAAAGAQQRSRRRARHDRARGRQRAAPAA